MYGCDIPRKCKIGKNVEFPHHALGVVITSLAVVEDDVTIQHHVTIGTKDGKTAPHICKGAYIGAYAFLWGDITIGEGAVIGAHTFVNKDVLPYTKCVNDVKIRVIE